MHATAIPCSTLICNPLHFLLQTTRGTHLDKIPVRRGAWRTRYALGVAAASGSNAAEENAIGLVLSTSPCGPVMAANTGVAIAVSCTVVVVLAAVPCSMQMQEHVDGSALASKWFTYCAGLQML